MKYFIFKLFKLLSTLFFLTHLLGLTTEARRGDKGLDEQIARLEQERSKLYNKIADALDSSAKDLQQSNDSDAKQGLGYVMDLKKHLKIFNNTENLNLNLSILKSRRAEDDSTAEIFGDDQNKYSLPEKDDRETLDDTKLYPKGISTEETDREGIKQKQIRVKRRRKGAAAVVQKRSTFKAFSDKVYDKRFFTNKTWDKYLARLKMKQRVEEWLLKKAAEKEAIKKYREKLLNASNGGTKERCPRMGIRAKSKKKGGRKKKKFRGYYPCCRKCCKSSYLGCL